MNGKEALKHYRNEKGYTIRQLAALLQVSPKTVYSYESKDVQVTSMPVSRAIVYFGLLGVDVEEYFDSFYPYKEELSAKVEKWHTDNLVELSYDKLKTRLTQRITKAKERQILSESLYEEIYTQCLSSFELLKGKTDSNGFISVVDHEKYIVPIYKRLKMETYLIEDAYFKDKFAEAPYNLSELAEICDINGVYLTYVVNGKRALHTMHIITMLKLCYVLQLDFKKLFQMLIPDAL